MTNIVSSESSNQPCFIYKYFKHATSTEKFLFAVGIILAVSSLLVLSLYYANSAGYLSFPLTKEVFVTAGTTLFVAILFNLTLGIRVARHSAGQTIRRIRRSDYVLSGSLLEILVNKRSLRIFPEEHLDRFTRKLSEHLWRRSSMNIAVTFLRDNGSRMSAIDAGGPSKEYLDDLFSSIVLSPRLSFETIDSSSLAVPKADACDRDALKIYRQFGQAMMICHERFIIGQHFDPSLFKVAFSLDADQIDRSFEDLSLDEKLLLYRILLEAQGNSNLLISLLTSEEWDVAEARAIAEIYRDEEEGSLQDDELRSYLTRLAADNYDPQLRAIHSVAQGMKLLCIKGESASETQLNAKWNQEYFRRDDAEFSIELQGIVIDRNMIANCFRFSGLYGIDEIIQQKVQWLNEWIREDAMIEEIQKFLKFATGSTSLPRNANICILKQCGQYLPVPIAHTCSHAIELAPQFVGDPEGMNDLTKEGFIACLKFAACGDDMGAGYAFG